MLKKIIICIIIIVAIMTMCSCSNSPQKLSVTKFSGYIVGKEYYPARMSNEPKSYVRGCAIFAAYIAPTPVPVDEEYHIYVANTEKVIDYLCDSVTYNDTNVVCGKPYTITLSE